MNADAPDIFMGGVGQTASGVEVYGSPQIGVFMQGNDHTLEDAHVHDAARQCSDCGVRRHDQRGSVWSETFNTTTLVVVRTGVLHGA